MSSGFRSTCAGDIGSVSEGLSASAKLDTLFIDRWLIVKEIEIEQRYGFSAAFDRSTPADVKMFHDARTLPHAPDVLA